jgi:hypothetical protein
VTTLSDKIKKALDEGRILVLGVQVLVGFQFRSVFEPGFERLGLPMQHLRLGGLVLMLLALALLIMPATYHRIADRGEDSADLLDVTTGMIELALLPFALALGVDLYGAVNTVAGMHAGLLAGAAASAVALFFWYGLELLVRRRRTGGKQIMATEVESSRTEPTALEDRIDRVLTELRVVLPGAQTLLGFQLAIMLLDTFDKLPASSKDIHLASLALVTLTIVLLMTPAAYHRIVERGEDTEGFCRFAGHVLLVAVVPLALGISGDLFLVTNRVMHDAHLAAVFASGMLLVFYGLWFVFPLWRRRTLT